MGEEYNYEQQDKHIGICNIQLINLKGHQETQISSNVMQVLDYIQEFIAWLVGVLVV
jgi:hypothetical protein